MEYPEMSADNPRVNALSNMWYEFAREQHKEIKEMIPQVSPWYAINCRRKRPGDHNSSER